MAYPPEFKYTKEHEWLAVDGTTGTIGITDHAQNSLGDIVFVELPKVGAELVAGKSFGTVESVKAVSDLYAPVSGTVTAINEELATSPEKVNSSSSRGLDGEDHPRQPRRNRRAALRRRLREVHRRGAVAHRRDGRACFNDRVERWCLISVLHN